MGSVLRCAKLEKTGYAAYRNKLIIGFACAWVKPPSSFGPCVAEPGMDKGLLVLRRSGDDRRSRFDQQNGIDALIWGGVASALFPMVLVRQEELKDVVAVRYVNERAFGQPDEADLVDALRARHKVTLSLVAVKDDQVVGHILFSPVTIESDEVAFPVLGLAPMAVLPEYQRQGIGSALVRAGLESCRNEGHECVIVLGHREYYPRFGFVPASRYGIKCEWGVSDEDFMTIELRDGALRGRAGVARYQAEFASL